MVRAMSRRHVLRGAAVGAAGVTGAAVLAACGEAEAPQIITQEVPVEKTVIKEVPVERIVRETEIKEVPVERIVTQEKIVTQRVEVPVERVVTRTVTVEKIVEAAPQTRTVKIEHATDHSSGPRGAAMQWAIEQFAVQRPDIKVKFIPQDHIYYEKIAIEAVAGTLSETNLLNGVSFQQFAGAGIWLEIDDILAKKAEYDPENYYFQPDIYSDNRDQSFPYDSTRLQGPLYGLPYQGAIGGMAYNVTMFDAAGANHPEEGWRYSDLLEEMRKLRDPEAGVYGIRATRSEQFQVFPQMYGYNNGQARVMGPDGHQIWGRPSMTAGAAGQTSWTTSTRKTCPTPPKSAAGWPASLATRSRPARRQWRSAASSTAPASAPPASRTASSGRWRPCPGARTPTTPTSSGTTSRTSWRAPPR